MATRKPLVNTGGDASEIVTGDTLNCDLVNSGYVATATDVTVDLLSTRFVSVTVLTLTTRTVTVNVSNARPGFELWVMRADSNSVGTLNVVTSSGTVQSPATNIVSGITSIVFPATISRVGYVWSGTSLLLLSST